MRATYLKKPVMTSTAVTQDEWVTAALTEDQVVVELLLRLKHAGTVQSENPAANLPLMRWAVRQRRSRPSRLGVGVGGFLKKEKDSARASPVTPLCWSGGSGSGGSADGFEDTSRQESCSTSTGSGSKAVHATNETTSTCSKRSKKIKTFLELKDAEKLQLKERLYLEKKIANVQATYENRSAKNQSLKRIKLQFNSDRVKTIPISISNIDKQPHKRRRLPCSISTVKDEQHVSESWRETTSEPKSSEEKGFFFLPDLNMTPTEHDVTLYGTS